MAQCVTWHLKIWWWQILIIRVGEIHNATFFFYTFFHLKLLFQWHSRTCSKLVSFTLVTVEQYSNTNTMNTYLWIIYIYVSLSAIIFIQLEAHR